MINDDIEIVIKIPNKYKNVLLEGSMTNDQIMEVYRAARKGIILPKGHGRLIDAKDVGEYLTLADVPTIIEADKENNNIFEKMTEEEQTLAWMFMIFNKDKIIEKTEQWTKKAESEE